LFPIDRNKHRYYYELLALIRTALKLDISIDISEFQHVMDQLKVTIGYAQGTVIKNNIPLIKELQYQILKKAIPGALIRKNKKSISIKLNGSEYLYINQILNDFATEITPRELGVDKAGIGPYRTSLNVSGDILNIPRNKIINDKLFLYLKYDTVINIFSELLAIVNYTDRIKKIQEAYLSIDIPTVKNRIYEKLNSFDSIYYIYTPHRPSTSTICKDTPRRKAKFHEIRETLWTQISAIEKKYRDLKSYSMYDIDSDIAEQLVLLSLEQVRVDRSINISNISSERFTTEHTIDYLLGLSDDIPICKLKYNKLFDIYVPTYTVMNIDEVKDYCQFISIQNNKIREVKNNEFNITH